MATIRTATRDSATAIIITRRAPAKRTFLINMATPTWDVGIMVPIRIIPTPTRAPTGIGITIPPRIVITAPARAAGPIPIIVIIITEAHIPTGARVAIMPGIPWIPTLPIVTAIIKIIVDVNVGNAIILAIITIIFLVFALVRRGFAILRVRLFLHDLRVTTRERKCHEHGSEGKHISLEFHIPAPFSIGCKGEKLDLTTNGESHKHLTFWVTLCSHFF